MNLRVRCAKTKLSTILTVDGLPPLGTHMDIGGVEYTVARLDLFFNPAALPLASLWPVEAARVRQEQEHTEQFNGGG